MHKSSITPRVGGLGQKFFNIKHTTHHCEQSLFLSPTRPIPGQVNDLIQNVALGIVISMHQCACKAHAFTHTVLRMLLRRYDCHHKLSYQNQNMKWTQLLEDVEYNKSKNVTCHATLRHAITYFRFSQNRSLKNTYFKLRYGKTAA